MNYGMNHPPLPIMDERILSVAATFSLPTEKGQDILSGYNRNRSGDTDSLWPFRIRGKQEGHIMFLGIQDPWVWLAYILSILSTVLCIGWGIVKWNKGEKKEEPEEEIRHWAEEEDKVEEEL
ncbi:MAG: symporter small accessory protein [Lentisphaerota bacterium]